MKKLVKNIDFKTKIPSYASLKRGAVVKIQRPDFIKKYQKAKDSFFDKTAVVIGYAIQKAGKISYAVRVVETGDEYILYNYLLASTGQTVWLPIYEVGEDVVVKSSKIKGKWAKVLDVNKDTGVYTIVLNMDQRLYKVKEKDLKSPTEKDLNFKTLETEFPEIEGTF